MKTLTGKQLINGIFKAEGTTTFTAMNPATSLPLEPHFTEATTGEVAEACRFAAGAFDVYAKTGEEEKARFLETIAAEIQSLGDGLLETAHKETGLPLARLGGERSRTINQLYLFAGMLKEGSWVTAIIDTAEPERQPAPKPDLRQMQVPLGPVAVFGASNFPFAFSVAGGDTVSALAAGCPVVFKAHPAHPATCELMAVAITAAAEKCGLPAGVFSMVQGRSNSVGEHLVQHPAVKAVGFTGSFVGGKALFDLAAKRPEPIPVYAEMGSVNPVFFLPRILKEKSAVLAKNFAASIALGSGQFCTNPGSFALLKNDDEIRFVEQTKQALQETVVGTMLTEGIRNSYLKGVQHLARQTGEILEEGVVQAVVFTTGLKDVLENESLLEEVFGPCSVGIVANTKDELLSLAKTLKGQLTATVHGTGEDLEEYKDLLFILQNKAGRLIINSFPTGVEVTHAMVHGGPFPATTDSRTTSVGTGAIYRFTRPVCFQDFPSSLLPDALKDENPLGIWRKVNGILSKG